MKRCTKTRSGKHEFYKDTDFTEEELAGKNKIAVLAIIRKKKICKRCGLMKRWS